MKYIVRNTTFFFAVWLLGNMFFSGCVKEEFTLSKLDTSLDLNPALATPLGYFDFRLDENLQTSDNAVIALNPDRIISLNYFGEIISESASSLFQFNPISEEFSSPNYTGSDVDLSIASYESETSFSAPLFLTNTGSRAELDRIILSSGMLSISSIELPDARGEIVIEIPELKLKGESFRIQINQGDERIIENIDGYSLGLSHTENRNNLIEVNISVSYPQQNSILYATKPLVGFHFDINIDQWEKIYGYLGSERIDFGRTSFSTDINDNFAGGDFYFLDPELSFKTFNSFSIPIALGLPEISALTKEDGTILVRGPGIPVPPKYFHPSYPEPENISEGAEDSLLIRSDNSNLRDITTSTPQSINFQVEFLSNPEGVNKENVVHSDSKFSTRVELKLPFHGRAKLLKVKDTLSMNFSELDFPVDDIVNQVIFKLYYENSFPAEIDLQLYLADHEMVVRDTLFDSFVRVQAADPTEDFTENPDFVSGQVEGYLQGDKLEDIRATRYIIGEALLSTPESHENVKIFDNQNLFLNMGIVFDISTSIEDF